MILHLLRHTHSDICTQCSEYSWAYGKPQHQPCLLRLLFPRQLLLNEHIAIKMVLNFNSQFNHGLTFLYVFLQVAVYFLPSSLGRCTMEPLSQKNRHGLGQSLGQSHSHFGFSSRYCRGRRAEIFDKRAMGRFNG